MDRYNLGCLSGTEFSTEEQLYGTWIDGSPIYQKVIEIESVPKGVSQTVLNLADTDFGDLIEHKIVAKFTSNSLEYTVTAPYFSSTSDYLYCFKRDNLLMLNAGRAYTNLKIILRYTKISQGGE